MQTRITALNLLTLDLLFAGIRRLPGLGEEIATSHLELALGGGPTAALAAAARLGADTALATWLGTDRFSQIARAFLEQEGLPYRSFPAALPAGASPVNLSAVLSVQDSDRSFVSYFPDTDFYSRTDEALVDYLAQGAYCIASAPNVPLFRALRERGCRVVYDVGWSDDLSLDALAPALHEVYLFTPNEKEARKLTGLADPEQALRKIGELVPCPVVKLGENGAIFLEKGESRHIPAFPVAPVDTTGAGDAFLGGLVFGLSRGWDMGSAVRLGNYTGGKAATALGCLTARPSMEEFEQWQRK